MSRGIGMDAPLRVHGALLVGWFLVSLWVSAARGSAEAAQHDALLPTLFPELREQLSGLPAFVRDTKLTLNFCTIYRYIEASNGKESEAWAAGGWLAYRSGWLANTFAIGATVYTSQPVYAPEDRDGTLLLAPGQAGFTVLGEAYAALRYRDHVLTSYRQSLKVGYVNPQDDRMVPNIFEGSTLAGKVGWLTYTTGYLTRMKTRNSDEFLSFSEVAGAKGGNKGLALIGLRAAPWRDFWLEATDAYVGDTINIAFGQTEYSPLLARDLRLLLGLQYTDQRSVGKNLLTRAPFHTWVVSGRAGVSGWGATLAAAFSVTDDGADIRAPFGAYPGYLNRIRYTFNRANEEAWGVFLGYDFATLGLPELTALFVFARGTDALNPRTRAPAPNRQVYDIIADYRPTGGLLRGLSLRLRVGLGEEKGKDHLLPAVRLSVNYEIPLL